MRISDWSSDVCSSDLNEGRNPPNANDFATATNLVERNTERRNYRLGYRYDDPDRPALDLHVTAYRNEIRVDELRFADARSDHSDFSTNGMEAYNTSRLDVGLSDALALTYGLEVLRDPPSGPLGREAGRE